MKPKLIIFWLVAIAAYASFCFLVVIPFLRDNGIENLLWFGAILIVLISLALLMKKYPAVSRYFDQLLLKLFKIVVWYLLFFLPFVPFRFVYNLVLNGGPVWLQVLIFTTWGIVLIIAIQFLLFEKKRTRIFRWLYQKVGSLAPFAYSFNLLFIAIYFFGSITYTLVNAHVIQLVIPSGEITPEKILDFYFWHFLDSVPVLEINDTLKFKEPLTYDNGLVGLLLFIFKITVISPIIGAFVWSWKLFKQEPLSVDTSKRTRRRYHKVSRRRFHIPGRRD